MQVIVNRVKKEKPKFIGIYNCSDPVYPSIEIVAVKDVRHVFLHLPDKEVLTIEVYNPALRCIRSYTETYANTIDAKKRLLYLIGILGAETQKYNGQYQDPITEDEYEHDKERGRIEAENWLRKELKRDD